MSIRRTPIARGGRVSEKDKKRLNPTARYSNFFQVGHNAYEFLLEFGQQDSEIHTRIYLSPQHARMLSDLLLNALREHNLLSEKDPINRKTEIQ
jgi:Protein of unknown function (DUF3467)